MDRRADGSKLGWGPQVRKMSLTELEECVQHAGGTLWPKGGAPTKISYLRRELADNALNYLSKKQYAIINEIELAYSNVSDTAVTCLKGQPQLKSLSLTGTPITGACLSELDFPHLESLRIDRCDNLDPGFVAQGLSRFSSLRHLNLHDAVVINDACAEAISRLDNLEHLDLSGTAITDVGLQALARLVNLQYISLQRTAHTSRKELDRLFRALPNRKRQVIIP